MKPILNHIVWALCGVLCGSAGNVHSNTLVVTSTADGGAGSLRATVAAAAAGDTINFSVTGKIVLTSGPIVVNKPLTIAGPGPKQLTISGNHVSRVITVSDGNPATDSPVSISGLTLADGYIGNCITQSLSSGGAIGSSESLMLSNVVVRDSFASANGGGLNYGAIGSGLNLVILNSAFINNHAGCIGATNTATGGGLNIGVDGAATPTVTATVLIQDTDVEANWATRHGGGIRLTVPGSIVLHNVRVRGNHAHGFGGGIAAMYSNAGIPLPTINIDSSEISFNSAGNSLVGGGGLVAFNDELGMQTAAAASNVFLRNSTISGNAVRGDPASGSGAPGAGISVYGNTKLVVQNSTIAWNQSTQATAAPSQAGGIYRQIGVQSGTSTANFEGTVSIESSIFSDNLGTIGPEDIGQSAEPFANPYTLTKSLFRYPGSIAPGAGNIVSQDPLLLPLGDYGGPTATHALASGSQAIDAGSNPAGAAYDQRGLPRVVNGTADMGAFESGNVIPLGCLDADANGSIDALTDGLIFMRAMFGMTGTSVTTAALGANATRTTWQAIRGFLNANCGSSFAP